MTTNRPLKVFLCHSSADKPAVRELYQKLRAEPWIQPWLDEEELYPGQDWEIEIERAVESSDVVLVCLSISSINKRGFVQKELRFALDVALEMPEETIFIVPLRLEECTPPRSLRDWQYADYFESQRDRGFERLLVSLRKRAESLGIYSEKIRSQKEKADIIDRLEELISQNQEITRPTNIDYEVVRNKLALSNGMEFMRVPAGKFLMGGGDDNKYARKGERPEHFVDIPYDYWMARFPVTNEQYNLYVVDKGIKHPVDNWEKKKKHPVVFVSWNDAIAYCHWLNKIFANFIPSKFKIFLPTEAQWEKAARGTDGRKYHWGNYFDESRQNEIRHYMDDKTTSIDLFSESSDSPYGCAYMKGDLWEWTTSLTRKYPYNAKDGRENEGALGNRIVRGGLFYLYKGPCTFHRLEYDVTSSNYNLGIRVVLRPTGN